MGSKYSVRAVSVLVFLPLVFLPVVLTGQTAQEIVVPLKNWAAPLYWQPNQSESETGGSIGLGIRPMVTQTSTGALTFVAITPCRLVDTRGVPAGFNGLTPFSGPSLAPSSTVTFPVQSAAEATADTTPTPCGTIPSTAQAYSFNITAIPKTSGGIAFVTVWPSGAAQPAVSTINDGQGVILANAAVVPAGTPDGGVNVINSGPATMDLIIDMNGYYAATGGGGGGGSITGVTAGTDLTGGGTSGVVTLNLDTTMVPTLAGANTFTAANFFATNVGIGTVTPAAKLEVNGAAQVDGNVTITTSGSGLIFADGSKQTTAAGGGGGGGSITGVTAGTGLTGGGTSGIVTLNLNTALVPTLAGNNSFTGTNTFASGVVTSVTAGTDLTGGGTGGAVTLNLNTALVPTLAGANTFAATNTFAGNISLGGSVLYQGSPVLQFPGGLSTFNTSLGFEALSSASSGSGNTALGGAALNNNSSGAYNTASGATALGGNIAGSFNTASGYGALSNNNGSYNTAVGVGALMTDVSGSGSVAIGYDALSNSTATGTASNTAVGYQALQGGSTPSQNIGVDNTATGYQALQLNTSGSYNTAHGFKALQSNTTGAPNTAFGASALQSNTTGSDNSASGYLALSANTIGHDNSASGFQALLSNVSGNQNTASGSFALVNNISDNDNTAVGFRALLSNNGGGLATQNTAVGSGALQQNTAAFGNTALGYQALQSANGITEGENTAVGSLAMQLNNGYINTAVGYQALQGGATASANTGQANTAMGYQALGSTTGGYNNTAIGAAALQNNTTGNNNLAIGIQAAQNVSGGNSNNIHIGNLGASTDNQTIKIGNGQSSFFAAGIYGAGSGGVAVTINASGQLVGSTSSRRYKEDINDMGEASRGLTELRPVTFRYKKAAEDGSKPLQYGLIAEEVAEVYPDLVVYNKDGQPDAVQYQMLPAMLLNEVQRQQAEIGAQKEQLRRLEQQNASLLERLDKLEAALGATSRASGVAAIR
jgi:trimeric autotransporter adhesin